MENHDKKMEKLDEALIPSDQSSITQQENPTSLPPKSLEGKIVSLDEVIKSFVLGYRDGGEEAKKTQFKELLSKRLKSVASRYKCFSNYNILVLFDNGSMMKTDSDHIYKAVNALDKNKSLLLILLSNGGDPGSAYLIGKLCRESTKGKFIVTVPRYAKSAATLLSTAADEIHMGGLSELGPIDPQIKGMPTLGLKNAIENMAEVVNRMPGSSEMFARYLNYSVQPIQIGYYERAAKSLQQYAEKLLEAHKATLKSSPSEIASRLVYEYKDHSFIIDKSEALEIFGPETVKADTEEYQLGSSIYSDLLRIEDLAERFNYMFYFIGSLDAEPQVAKLSPKNS